VEAAPMIVAKWKIETDWYGPKRWFWVRVYDGLGPLRRISARVAPGHDGYTECVGCVQEVTPWIPDGYGGDQDALPVSELWFPESGFAGVVRLASEWLFPEVIWHEVLHAAVTVFRMNVDQRPQLNGLTDNTRENEELLAYFMGQLSADMDDGLRKYCGK
jgi:hypothetical protein